MRPPANVLEKIAIMRYVDLPFEMAVALSIDWKQVADDLSIRQITGSFAPDNPRPIERLALVALAFYAPQAIGINPEELERPDLDVGYSE